MSRMLLSGKPFRHSDQEAIRRVAFYVAERSPYAARVLEGLLRYVENHVGIQLRDYLDDVTTEQRRADVVGHRPPWAGWEPHGVVAILPHGSDSIGWVRGGTGAAPVVSIGGGFRGQLPTVYVSPDSIAELAVDHLEATGYEHVAFVGVAGFAAVDLRREAIERRLASAGRPLHTYELTKNPWPGLYDLEEAAAWEDGLHQMLRDAPKPLGVVTTTDQVGRSVCMACEAIGLAVPEEVGVLGIDNYPAARSCQPPLSSIHSPGEEVGYQAMTLLDQLIRGEATSEGADRAAGATVAVPATQLVPRRSTGADPGGGTEADVVRALALIRQRACEGVAVEEILEELTVSRSTLERRFAARIGRTPGQELLRARLARAKELLRNTDLSISRIAEMIGYERSSSFSDFFRKNAGTSPKAFRATGVDTAATETARDAPGGTPQA